MRAPSRCMLAAVARALVSRRPHPRRAGDVRGVALHTAERPAVTTDGWTPFDLFGADSSANCVPTTTGGVAARERRLQRTPGRRRRARRLGVHSAPRHDDQRTTRSGGRSARPTARTRASATGRTRTSSTRMRRPSRLDSRLSSAASSSTHRQCAGARESRACRTPTRTVERLGRRRQAALRDHGVCGAERRSCPAARRRPGAADLRRAHRAYRRRAPVITAAADRVAARSTATARGRATRSASRRGPGRRHRACRDRRRRPHGRSAARSTRHASLCRRPYSVTVPVPVAAATHLAFDTASSPTARTPSRPRSPTPPATRRGPIR